ncbi:MAG: MAPEG family protein [Candidatus Omnitrophica bacterium]|nr:MAPEG family protein [Candidatus Omnitrophota bacterium]
MIILTFIVWVFMYVRRIHYLVTHKVDIQSLSDPKAMTGHIPVHINWPSENLKNLFELPVIFYALCGFLAISHCTDTIFLYAAWIFVGCRGIHSIIHCTINIVMYRFYAYALSSLALWFMAGKLIFFIFK